MARYSTTATRPGSWRRCRPSAACWGRGSWPASAILTASPTWPASFTGLVPKIDQSGTNTDGHGGPTKAGDSGLRQALYLAANQLRKVDPQFAQRYYRLVVDEGKHHNSALCHLAANVATRIAACWRRREPYLLRDTDGRPITQAEGRAIVQQRFKIGDDVR